MTKDRTEQLYIIRKKVRPASDPDEDNTETKQGLVASRRQSQKQKRSNIQSYQSLQDVIVDDSKTDGFSLIFKQAEDIRSFLDELQGHIEEISQIQSQIISSPIPDEKSKSKLEDFTSAVKRTSLIIRKKLKEMESFQAKEPQECSMAVQRTCKIQYQTLLKAFVDKMTDFQTLQTNYTDGCKQRICRQLEISGSHFTEEQVEEMLEAGNWQVFSQGILTDTDQARKNLKDIEARHDEIMKLEKGLRELHGMFMEMAILVESQGVTIESIASQVEYTGDYVKGAVNTLKAAEKYQTSARKKKIVIFLIVVSIIAVIITLAALL